MHRVSGHREPGSRSRRVLLILVPVVVLTLVAVVLGRSLLGSPDTALTSAPYSALAKDGEPTPTPSVAATTAAPVVNRNLGTRRGVITLTGPATVADGARVRFVLTGPKGVRRSDQSAPYAVKINSARLPNGRYTLKVEVIGADGEITLVSTGKLTIKNPPPKKKPTPTPTPTPTPSRTGSGSGSGGSSGGSGGGSGGSGGGAPSTGSGFAAQVLDLANAARKDAGCNNALKLNADLNQAAQAHSVDMATHNFFSHDSRDGRSAFDRITASGYKFSGAAENIAAGSTTAAGAMNQWMNSPGHRANILNCGLDDLGVGFARGVNADFAGYWTQDFGSPR